MADKKNWMRELLNSPGNGFVIGTDDLEGYEETEGIDTLMRRPKKAIASTVMFLLAAAIIVGVMGYVVVDDDARQRVAAFIRGDLFQIQKQRTEELQRLYMEKMAQLSEKYGDIRLEYYPRDAKVHIIQRTFVYDSLNDDTPEPWGDPKEIDNASLHLKEDEQLPYLSVKNLPVRERGKLCFDDGKFYPASKQYCPGWEKCANLKANADEKEMKKYTKHALKSVQYCPDDDKYYPDILGTIQMCPGSKTLMDPSKVPIFVYQYDFVFEREDYLPQVITYTEKDWIDVGAQNVIIPFPKDFMLLRAWGPLKKKYAEARKKMRCWRRAWEDCWQNEERARLREGAKEKIAEAAKKKEEMEAAYKSVRSKYTKVLSAIDIIRRIKQMATIRQGMAEIFYYCPEMGKCDENHLQELKNEDERLYWAVQYFMKVSPKRVPELEVQMAKMPIVKAGLVCLRKWLFAKKPTPDAFVKIDDKECIDAIESIKGIDDKAYTALLVMFRDPEAGKQYVDKFAKEDIENYLKSVKEYKGAEKYDDLVRRIEKTGTFLEYVINLYLFDPRKLDEVMDKYIKSRQVNYVEDCEARRVIPSDNYRGLKKGVEVAWWSGSKLLFQNYYNKLWVRDVQGCLLFLKEHDPKRYKEDLAKFEKYVAEERKLALEQRQHMRSYLKDLRYFQEARAELKKAYSLYKTSRALFYKTYPEAIIKSYKTKNPALYLGLLYLANPAKGKKLIQEMKKLPEPKPWEPPKKEGDQVDYHKYLAYMEIFNPKALEKGLNILRQRVQPLLMTKEEYEEKRLKDPTLPPYDDAIREIVRNDIHLKYFWLLKLIESPSKFDREFKKLDRKEAMEIARWIDPERYIYLADLIWLKTEVDRYDEVVPLLQDTLEVDYSLYQEVVKKLKAWARVKSLLVRRYKRGKRVAEAWRREPTMALTALEKYLKIRNRFAYLAKNLQDYEEAKINEYVRQVTDELRDVVYEDRKASWEKYVEPTNERIRLKFGFTKKEWETLTKEFERRPENAEWYNALQESLKGQRLDCRKIDFPIPEDFKKEMKNCKFGKK